MLKRISIIGPESTGKTWLTKKLAWHYNTEWVHEYAVDYLSEHGASYILDDILKIARGQIAAEEQMQNKARSILFCDTDLIVTKIWSKVVFGKVPGWIEQQIVEHQYDLYLLCSPDIEWEDAPFRENPNDGARLFDLYKEELINQNFNFRIITGLGDQRLKNAVNFVDELLNG